jgi:hypothetical protein
MERYLSGKDPDGRLQYKKMRKSQIRKDTKRI